MGHEKRLEIAQHASLLIWLFESITIWSKYSQSPRLINSWGKIKYTSAIDDIEIIHTAHNRKGFAGGAVLAAEFLVGKKGIFNMKQVLGFD